MVDLATDHDGGHGVASGAVVTLAARLQEHAPPGGVALCPATHRAVAGLIAQRPVPAVTVAGKTLPVDVWHATGTERPRPPRHGGALLGRRRELAVAREHLAEATRGRGEAHVTDDPETVRGRLAAALTPLVPAELLTPALDTVDDLLGVTPGQARAVTYWWEVLLSLARRQPVVVAVDDLDRAAPALRRQLATLVDLADERDLPLLLVATGDRERGVAARRGAGVRLSPLDTISSGRSCADCCAGPANRPGWLPG
ncbi:hypothetical protein [Verrucosispora sioxanthis]|uniref:hypothetical protein n=1 Tax=Verrucosispora sioxanthis TaxID=2499994 RepID=UPI0020A08F3D|nr:hypothetical protein [Verrucosispora sioxanthis]